MENDLSTFYDHHFYDKLEKEVLKSSKVLAPIIVNKYNPKSILDIGCGNGIWLKTFEDYGINDYLGTDGDYVNEDIFRADYSKFIAKNLESEVNFNKKFDLAISLEVGEHISKHSSETYIKSICKHSDLIIFSAAIPGQKGTNHINENPQSFWAELFKKQGFHPYDEIRPIIWYDSRILYWYRQNIIVYKKETNTKPPTNKELNLIHPEFKFREMNIKNIFFQVLIAPVYVFKRFLNKQFRIQNLN